MAKRELEALKKDASDQSVRFFNSPLVLSSRSASASPVRSSQTSTPTAQASRVAIANTVPNQVDAATLFVPKDSTSENTIASTSSAFVKKEPDPVVSADSKQTDQLARLQALADKQEALQAVTDKREALQASIANRPPRSSSPATVTKTDLETLAKAAQDSQNDNIRHLSDLKTLIDTQVEMLLKSTIAIKERIAENEEQYNLDRQRAAEQAQRDRQLAQEQAERDRVRRARNEEQSKLDKQILLNLSQGLQKVVTATEDINRRLDADKEAAKLQNSKIEDKFSAILTSITTANISQAASPRHEERAPRLPSRSRSTTNAFHQDVDDTSSLELSNTFLTANSGYPNGDDQDNDSIQTTSAPATHVDYPLPPILAYRETDQMQALANYLMHDEKVLRQNTTRVRAAFDQARLSHGAVNIGTLFTLVSCAMHEFKDIMAESSYNSPPKYPSLYQIAKDFPNITTAIYDGFYIFLDKRVPEDFRHQVGAFVEKCQRIANNDNTMFLTMLYFACDTAPTITTISRIVRFFVVKKFPRADTSYRLPGYFNYFKDTLCCHLYLAVYDVKGSLAADWYRSSLFCFVNTYNHAEKSPKIPPSAFIYPFQDSPNQLYNVLYSPFPYEATLLYPIWKVLGPAKAFAAADFSTYWAAATHRHLELSRAQLDALQMYPHMLPKPPEPNVLLRDRQIITWKSVTQGAHEGYMDFFKFFNKITNAESKPDYSNIKEELIDSATLPREPPSFQSAPDTRNLSDSNPITRLKQQNDYVNNYARSSSGLFSSGPSDSKAKATKLPADNRPYAANLVPREVYSALPQHEKDARSAAYHRDKANYVSPKTNYAKPEPASATAPTRSIKFDDNTSVISTASTIPSGSIPSIATTISERHPNAARNNPDNKSTRPDRAQSSSSFSANRSTSHLAQVQESATPAPVQNTKWTWKRDTTTQFANAVQNAHATKDKRSHAFLLQLGQDIVDEDPHLTEWVNAEIDLVMQMDDKPADIATFDTDDPGDDSPQSLTELFDPNGHVDPYYCPDDGDPHGLNDGLSNGFN